MLPSVLFSMSNQMSSILLVFFGWHCTLTQWFNFFIPRPILIISSYLLCPNESSKSEIWTRANSTLTSSSKENNELKKKIISNITIGMKGSEWLNFFKFLWSLCSNILDSICTAEFGLWGRYRKAGFLNLPLYCALWNKGNNPLSFSLKQWTY